MNTTKLAEDIGDLTVYDLAIDFKNKSIKINLGYLPFENKQPIKTVSFENVIWQDFSGFHTENIQCLVEYSNDFNVFLKRKDKYIKCNNNYFPIDFLENLKNNKHHYYYFQPTSGFEFFIISRTEIKISNI